MSKWDTSPKKWKTAKIIPIIKPGKENSMDPSKYRPTLEGRY